MELKYKPSSKLEKFGEKIYNLLVENFPRTFFIGGAVRDMLLQKKITDIDLATSAEPEQVVNILNANGIETNGVYKKFGAITARQGSLLIEITTFRQDLAGNSRYHKVRFVKDPKIDAKRRDFTVNSLYLSLKTGKILDFTQGLDDIKNTRIRFIGNPVKRIEQDPLRIIRALRFCLSLNFTLEKKSYAAIKKNFSEVDKLTQNKIQKEINKIKLPTQRNILKKVINNPAYLDKYFK